MSGRPGTSSDNPEVSNLRVASFDVTEQTLAAVPNSPAVLNLLGTLHLRSNSEETARQIWSRLTREFPDSEEAWLNLAHLEIKQGNYSKACECFQQAEEISPSTLELYSPYADAAFQAGRINLAIAVLARKAKRVELSEADLCIRGRAESASGETRKAIESFSQALKLVPDSREALNGLAQGYRAAGDPNNAKLVATKLSQIDARASRVEASRDVEGRDYRLAEQLYALAVTQCINVLNDNDKKTDAIKQSLACQELAPHSRIIFITCVNLLLADKQYDRAMRQYLKYTSKNPEDAEVWIHFAETALRLRRFQAAELAAREAIRLEPNDAKPLSLLCQTLIASGGDLDEAVRVASRAHELDKSAAGAYLLGTAQYHAKDLAAARQSLEQAVKLAPKNSEYRRALFEVTQD